MRPEMYAAIRRPSSGRVTESGIGGGVALDALGPAQPPGGRMRRLTGVLLFLAITAVAGAQYGAGHSLIPVAWLSVGPLLASLLLAPLITAGLAAWALVLGAGLVLAEPGRPGLLVSHLTVLLLLAGFAVAN